MERMESLERRHRVEPQWSTTRLLVEVFRLSRLAIHRGSMPKIHRCANGLVSPSSLPSPKLGREQKVDPNPHVGACRRRILCLWLAPFAGPPDVFSFLAPVPFFCHNEMPSLERSDDVCTVE